MRPPIRVCALAKQLADRAVAVPAAASFRHESFARQAFSRFVRHRLAVIGGIILLTVILVAVFAPFVLPSPLAIDLRAIKRPPSVQHPLGTDLQGRDVLSRVVSGTRTSLIVGFGAMLIFVTIGTVAGLLAGFYGRTVDQVIMRTTDAFLAAPALLMIIVFVSLIGPSLSAVIVVIALLGWPGTARLVRGQLLSLREMDFVTAARVMGLKSRSIVTRHMLPNVLGAITVVATFGLASAILLEAALSFLGLGVRPPDPSLGGMIKEAQSPEVLLSVPWLWAPAGVAIALIVLAVNFVGDGLRDALDPRATPRA
jgi:peptide/nickel transport system permease protein